MNRAMPDQAAFLSYGDREISESGRLFAFNDDIRLARAARSILSSLDALAERLATTALGGRL